MRMYDLILKKRNNTELTERELQYIVDGYVEGSVPDYQMSAFLMAVMFTGMTKRELGTFTMAMAQSGTMVDLSDIDGIKVDKHSTGGVGDKTTLIISAIVAACGGKVAKMSGRGLGHTGGTIDKMESIPGLTTTMTQEAFISQVKRLGLAVIGQSDTIAPADKKIYALRDVTATVDSIPLIASSIMSKKLASGADAILLDVKMGSGAFMKTYDDAHRLARAMVDIGKANGRAMKAIITDMDTPLGNAIGNALEIEEVIRTLKGEGPEDLTDECLVMAAHMLVLSGLGDYEDCYEKARQSVQNGFALHKLQDMITAQGGDGRVAEKLSLLPHAPYTFEVIADRDGYIRHMDAEHCGTVSVMLGAGRTKKGDAIDFGAGIVMHAKTGDRIRAGQSLATLYARDESLFAEASDMYRQALTVEDTPGDSRRMIWGVVE